ncbi:MAG: hypothetical protein R3B40_29055 [Polyangiales bacterium]
MRQADADAPTEALVTLLLARSAHVAARTDDDSERRFATVRWLRAKLAAHSVWLLDDHDPRLAPGFFEAHEGALDLDRLRPTLRSWEAFDRGFDACDATLEATLVDTRVIPFLEAIGVAEHSEDALDVLGHHLVVLDQRYAGSFPSDRWQEHLTRRVAGDAAQKPNDTPA